jgi:hypothetical protein
MRPPRLLPHVPRVAWAQRTGRYMPAGRVRRALTAHPDLLRMPFSPGAPHSASARVAAAALLALAVSVAPLRAQPRAANAGYHSHAALARSLDSLRRALPNVVAVTQIATSPGGRAVHLVRVGAGADVDARPALLVLANAYGPHVVGSEAALGAARSLAGAYGRDAAVTRLLDRNTVYVVPRLNPDAAESFFAGVAQERTRNGGGTHDRDDDRDGSADEDGPDDLNGDGMITMMRVADPAGEWMADAVDSTLMRRADAARGEVGRYRVMVEGRDDDGDERFNEDPAGGTDINRNFTFGYEWFGEGSGIYQLAAPEARAVADLIVSRPNIAAVYVLGPQDNLVKPWEFRAATGIGGAATGTSAGGPLQSILREDEPYYAELGRRYRRVTGITRTPAAEGRGDPLAWAYYDMGRLAFGSRVWSVPDAAADTSKGAPRPETPDPVADERNALRWLRANRPEALLPWTTVRHPDFAGRTVQVGGFRPFALLNPPPALLDSVIAKQARFVTELAGMLPAVSLREVRVERVSERVFRVTAQVANSGLLPTNAAIGSRTRWPLRVRVELVPDGQEIAGGRRVQLLDSVRGSGRSTELSWLVVGAPGSNLTLRASSPVAGSASQTITLRDGSR